MPDYNQEVEENQFDDDYWGMDDFDLFNEQTEKSSIVKKEDFLTSEYKDIALILDKEVEAIVQASQPNGDLIYLSGEDRVKFIDEWRQNIFDNLNALAQTENAFSSKEYFSKNRADYYEKRKGQIEAVESGKSNNLNRLKQEKKSGITNVKKERAEKSIGFIDGLKEKKALRKNFRSEKRALNNESQTDIKNLTEGYPEGYEGNGVGSKDEHSEKPLRQLYGILDGETNKEDQNTINPFEDFQLKKSSDSMKLTENEAGELSPQMLNVTNYVYFDFLGIETLDDITPLLPPRARDSIIDTGTTLPGDNNFKLYPELAAVKDNTEFNEVVTNYLGGTTGNTSTIIANSSNDKKTKEAKKNWEKSETGKTTTTLEEDYTDLYGLDLNFNEYNRDENVGTYKETDDSGNVTPEAKTRFFVWLSKQAIDKSLGVIWNNQKREFTAVKQEGEDKKSENSANEIRAKNYNEIIKSTDTKPWDLDMIKRDILVGLSKSLINEQKWQGQQDMTEGSFSEWESAGGVKKDNSISDAQKNNQGETFKVSKFVETGTYKQTQPKRNSKYDEKTGYRESPEKTIIPDDNWVDEKLNWKVDYRVRIRERTDNK